MGDLRFLVDLFWHAKGIFGGLQQNFSSVMHHVEV